MTNDQRPATNDQRPMTSDQRQIQNNIEYEKTDYKHARLCRRFNGCNCG